MRCHHRSGRVGWEEGVTPAALPSSSRPSRRRCAPADPCGGHADGAGRHPAARHAGRPRGPGERARPRALPTRAQPAHPHASAHAQHAAPVRARHTVCTRTHPAPAHARPCPACSAFHRSHTHRPARLASADGSGAPGLVPRTAGGPGSGGHVGEPGSGGAGAHVGAQLPPGGRRAGQCGTRGPAVRPGRQCHRCEAGVQGEAGRCTESVFGWLGGSGWCGVVGRANAQ